jgi:hypothetical protein
MRNPPGVLDNSHVSGIVVPHVRLCYPLLDIIHLHSLFMHISTTDYVQLLVPQSHFWCWEQQIVGNTLLSSPIIPLTQFWASNDQCSELMALRKINFVAPLLWHRLSFTRLRGFLALIVVIAYLSNLVHKTVIFRGKHATHTIFIL